MKTLLLPLVLVTAATATTAQTKKIAHRSHNGSPLSFDINGSDNFGIVYKKKPDTAVTIPDSSRNPEPPAAKKAPLKKTGRKAK